MSTPLTAASLPRAHARHGAGARLVTAGLAVAVLDGLLALGTYAGWLGAPPARIFQAIVALIVGPGPAFTGGATTTALGVAIHVGVAFGWSAAYLLAYQQLPWLRRMTADRGGAIVAGAAYGAFVWAFMQYAVIPLARAVFPVDHGPVAPFRLDVALVGLVGHMIVVGQPIVHLIRARDDG